MISAAIRAVVIAYCLFFATLVMSTEIGRIEVKALLGTKAMVVVNGNQHLLAMGQTTAEGVKLISVEEEGVRLEVEGETAFYALGSTQIGSQYSRPEMLQERVYKDNQGMFRTTGSINGRIVSFLVDTGASAIAINSNEAKRLGINYLLNGQATFVNTASGTAPAWAVKLDRVSLGKIELQNITAIVIDSNSPADVLLGMTFLERLDVQHKGEVMLLETKF